MEDLVLLLTGLLSILVLSLIALIAWRGRHTSQASDEDGVVKSKKAKAPPVIKEGEGPRQRAGRRAPAPRRSNKPIAEEEDYEDDPLADEIALPMDGKLGAKKRAKLEAKAEKRAARERELEEREERRQRQAAIDEQRRLQEEKEREEEAKQAEEERLAKEEKARQELEEYMKMKEQFTVDEEGYDEELDANESQNKLQAFIEYIQNQKVVQLEDLAGHFQMRTQDAINRVQDLLTQELLVGVIDDRGKFIYITRDELASVAKFIRQRGRVSIAELAESSNSLINLQPVDVK